MCEEVLSLHKGAIKNEHKILGIIMHKLLIVEAKILGWRNACRPTSAA